MLMGSISWTVIQDSPIGWTSIELYIIRMWPLSCKSNKLFLSSSPWPVSFPITYTVNNKYELKKVIIATFEINNYLLHLMGLSACNVQCVLFFASIKTFANRMLVLPAASSLNRNRRTLIQASPFSSSIIYHHLAKWTDYQQRTILAIQARCWGN